VYDEHGAFKIPDLDRDAPSVVKKCPYRLTSGAIYIGEWLPDLKKRAGKGR